MKTILVDASFVVTALLEENLKVENRFRNILKKAQDKRILLISAKFLNLEVANAFRFAIKGKEKCLNLFKDFTELPIKTFVLSKNQIRSAIDTSYGLGTTVYDTSYHILAKTYHATFLTCDDEYYKKAKVLGDIEFIG